MSPFLAAGFALVEKGSARVPCKDHAAGTVGDAIIWVGGDVFKEMVDLCRCELVGGILLGTNDSQGHENLVVDVPCII